MFSSTLVDDWRLSELSANQRRDLMEIVEDRHDRGSIILATQIPLSSWHGAIGDATYADLILDRIVHAALYVGFAGRSIISGLWQGSGQPAWSSSKTWRRDCGPAPYTLLIRLDGILGRIAP